MRLLLLAIELLAIGAIVGLGIWAYASMRQRQLGRGRWQVVTRSLESEEGVVVELARPGQRAQRVAVISAGLSYEEFSEALAEAQADAEAKAAALNAGERPQLR